MTAELSYRFSKSLKIQKANFFSNESVDENEIRELLEKLENFDPLAMKEEGEKKAFWINCYNGFTNWLIIKRNIRGRMISNPFVFLTPKLKIGSYELSLDDMEHGVLRCNNKAPYKPWRQFKRNDPRVQLQLSQLDFRIHFALNCGAISCPAIAYYSSEKINQELDLAEDSFAAQNFVVDDDLKTVTCSLIFKANKKDFGDKYLNDPKYKGYRIIVNRYDWTVDKT